MVEESVARKSKSEVQVKLEQLRVDVVRAGRQTSGHLREPEGGPTLACLARCLLGG